MDNIKSIISNNEGQRDYNFLPPSVIPATYIKGKKGDTPITMEGIQYPMIGIDKYGVTFQQPDQQYNYKSKGVLEFPFMPGSTKKDEEMNKAQQGGTQAEQIQQLIAAYAQLKGVDPQEVLKQLQSLPKEKQQQALQSIAQEVQQAMAQQQQQQQQQGAGPEQQEAMMGQQDEEGAAEQEQEMQGQGMMEEGGEPCFGCFDHYNPSPQAQNLNWFYKATGGEAFPQAQTYFPYDRPGETRPNFMFELGGQSDIHRAYKMMKEGGFAMNPKKKKGGKFNHLDEFQKYLQSGGGKLPYKDIDPSEEVYNQMMESGQRPEYESIQNNSYQNMVNNAAQSLGNDANYGTPSAGKKVPMGSPYYDNEDIRNMINSGEMAPVPSTVNNKNNRYNFTRVATENENGTTGAGTGTNNQGTGNQQYTGKLNADNYTITNWNNGNIKKIKGTPNRPASNVSWNTPGAAYMQGAMNSKLFGSSGLGMALSTITGALNPNAPITTGSPFKAKYRRDGSLRKVKGSASDVYNFFNPNAASSDGASSSSTTTSSNTSGATTPAAGTSSSSTPKGFGSSLFDNNSSDINDLRRKMMGDYRNQLYMQNRKNTMGFAQGGPYHYLPMAQTGIDPFDAGNGSIDDLNKMNSSSAQDWNNYAIGQNNPSKFDYSGFQSSQNNNPIASDNNVKVKTTDSRFSWQPNRKIGAATMAILGAANAALDSRALKNKQDQYTKMQENQTAMSNPANFTGDATQTQFGAPGAALNDKRQVFPNGPGSNIGQNANYGSLQLYNNNQITRDGGTIHDRYEDGGEYELTDDEIQEILAAGGSIEYI